MHPRFNQADAITEKVIGGAIEVHQRLGPGLLEPIYEKCLNHELRLRQFETSSQKSVGIQYKDLLIEHPLRCDILVNDCLLLELKAVEQVLPIHKAQLLSYMKLLDVPLGLLINFHEVTLTRGVHRMILPGANQP